ncbi:MAG: hypothetical protein ACE5E1_05580 [Phycisphaerae bacterium]
MPVRIGAEVDTVLRRYALTQLLRLIGLTPRFNPAGEAVIHYGTQPVPRDRSTIRIPADAESLWQRQAPRVREVESVAVLHHGPPPSALRVGCSLTFDLVRAAAHWLTLESETRVTRRDIHGRVPAAGSLLGRLGRLNRPPVNAYARLLDEMIRMRGFRFQRSARWPYGRRYAVALTHDVDDPERPSPWEGIGLHILPLNAESPRRAYWALRTLARRGQARARRLRHAGLRPKWDFFRYARLEHEYGFRSSFYFSVINRRGASRFDVGYDISRTRYRRLMRALRREGWEIGLHASYETHLRNPSVGPQVRRLSTLLKRRVLGLRHHYLMLDPSRPLATLAEHARAGLLYDTSVGFNDAPGFRVGTALPFEPFDGAMHNHRRFVELPMTLSDMHLPRYHPRAAIDIVRRHLCAARECGGLAVLNWHVGNWLAAPAWREAYRAACRMLSLDSRVWVATPSEIARWWLSDSGV